MLYIMKWSIFMCCIGLCITSSQASQNSVSNTGEPCKCTGLIGRTLDCSSRGKSSLQNGDTCFGRTTKINLADNQFSTFPNNLGSSVVEVNMSSNLLTSLPRPPLLNPATKVLDLSNNKMDGESDELKALSSLRLLDVSENRLRSLSFLPEPCTLRSLNANSNVLGSLNGHLGKCTQLEWLDVSDNKLTSLSRSALSGLRKLQRLMLVRTGLVNLESGAFDDLVNLEYFDMSENRLTLIPPALFSRSNQLKTLFLDSNMLTTLPGDLFRGLTKLEWLRISKNRLTTLPSGIFSSLTRIKYIFLAENHLRSLPQGLFSGLNAMEGIGLWHNELTSLPPDLFVNLPALRSVGLAYNRLTSLPTNTFTGISSIDVIDLAHNKLTSLPDGLFQGINYLSTLDLSKNSFRSLSGRDLRGLKNLLDLDISNNLLTRLPSYDSDWPEITRAIFSSNKITQVNEAEVRSWLGSGSTKRTVKMYVLLSEAAFMRWALDDPHLTTTVEQDCGCGSVKLRKAEFVFCVDIPCSDPPSTTDGRPQDWKDAARMGWSRVNETHH